MTNKLILPGATLGVLGGGQLGRMFCVAARTMGYKVVVLDPDPLCGAGLIADKHIQAQYDDITALAQMAEVCDVITFEFENIPAKSVNFIAENCPVYPDAKALKIAQNRHVEKDFASSFGLQPVPYFHIENSEQVVKAAQKIGFPAILKSNTLGYDGKGQHLVDSVTSLQQAYKKMGNVNCVLEKKINIKCEVSVIMARNELAETRSFPVAENQHTNGILQMSIVPARISNDIAEQAIALAEKLVNALDYVGILAVEFFISTDNILYFNEMAPRPHNSGHYTKDACLTSQFEQQVRMMCGLTPGDTRLLSPVVMVNMLGELWPVNWQTIFIENNIKLHLYGKYEARKGRKMGHYNVLNQSVEQALSTAKKVFNCLIE